MRTTSFLATAALIALPAAAHAQLFDNTSWTPLSGRLRRRRGRPELAAEQQQLQHEHRLDRRRQGRLRLRRAAARVEGLYHSNTGSGVRGFPNGYARINGQIQQVSLMANALYDFFPAPS